MSKVDWNKIETEYITLGLSIRELSERYPISATQIANHCKKDNWVNKRDEYQSNIARNLIDNCSDVQIKGLEKLQEATNKAIEKIATVLEFVDDEKAIKTCADTIVVLTKAYRDLNGLMSFSEERDYDLAVKKLNFEMDKAGLNDKDDNESGIAFIPNVLKQDDDNVVEDGGQLG